MELNRRSITMRQTTIEATLAEDEVKLAIEAYVIARSDPAPLPYNAKRASTVQINDRTGEVSVVINITEELL